jgi:uncharacterized membrane protein HdeD (DUF308 family)
MKQANILRAIIYACAAAFLIFNQDHSISTGVAVVSFVSVGIAFGSLTLFRISTSENKFGTLVVPGGIAFVTALVSILASGNSSSLTFLTALIAALTGAIAIAEIVMSRSEQSTDRMELRISGAIGVLTALVFWLAPLDGLNAVGFFSAYLSILAVQRAIWVASPKAKE